MARHAGIVYKWQSLVNLVLPAEGRTRTVMSYREMAFCETSEIRSAKEVLTAMRLMCGNESESRMLAKNVLV